jgi:hypothetical protein
MYIVTQIAKLTIYTRYVERQVNVKMLLNFMYKIMEMMKSIDSHVKFKMLLFEHLSNFQIRFILKSESCRHDH